MEIIGTRRALYEGSKRGGWQLGSLAGTTDSVACELLKVWEPAKQPLGEALPEIPPGSRRPGNR